MNGFIIATQTIRAALAAGVREFVVCAGARNAALMEVLAQAENAGVVKVWRHFEERSAGFFALGRTMTSLKPCAVVTTSGTAVAELLPAMIEAYYQQRPLLAITADRPARFRQTGAPQAIEQENIFGVYAGHGPLSEWTGVSPWHCNCEIEEEFTIEPIDFSASDFQDVPASLFRPQVGDLARWLRDTHERGLVVILGGLESDEQEEIWHFLQDLRVPVLADATSGLREALSHQSLPDGDRMLRANPPGKILRIGDIPTGRYWRDLEQLTDIDVWSITRTGFPGLARSSRVTKGPAHRVVKALGQMERQDDPLELFTKTSRWAARIDDLLEALPESEPAWVRTVSSYASLGTSIFLGNSLPIREWNLFAQQLRPITAVWANRGANGIDGQLSTWFGITADEENAWALVGDLTALYDLAAPFILSQCQQKGRVLAVINNSGGGIFQRLPRLQQMQPSAREMMLNPHQVNLEGWATMWGINYCRATCLDDLDAFEVNDQFTVLEIMPDLTQTTEFWQRWDQFK